MSGYFPSGCTDPSDLDARHGATGEQPEDELIDGWWDQSEYGEIESDLATQFTDGWRLRKRSDTYIMTNERSLIQPEARPEPEQPEGVTLDCGHYALEGDAERIGEDEQCKHCHGTGHAQLGGRSVNARCGNCKGTGYGAQIRIVCFDCYQRAENIRREFDEIELRFLIDATDARGPGRMGNHDLYLRLLQKLQDALAIGRRCTRCTNRAAGDASLCTACAMKEKGTK